MSNPIGVGIIGLGTVGSGVVELLQDAPSSMRRRKHVDFALKRVAVRDMARPRAGSRIRGQAPVHRRALPITIVMNLIVWGLSLSL